MAQPIVTLQFHGYDTRLSTRPIAGHDACITEIPEIPAARWEIGDVTPSDRVTTVRCVPRPWLRGLLLGGGTPMLDADGLSDVRLFAPVLPDDTRIYLTAEVGSSRVDTEAWIARELVLITGRGFEPDIMSPYYYQPYIDVTRARRGTVAQRYDLPTIPSALGLQLSITHPRDASDLPVTLRLTDAVDGGEEILLRGVISEVADAGDLISITVSSSLRAALASRWPSIPALHPHSRRVFDLARDAFNFVTPTVESRVLIGAPSTGVEGWDLLSNTTGVNHRSARTQSRSLGPPPTGWVTATERLFRQTVCSTGPRYWRGDDGGAAPLREQDDPAIAAWGAQPYGDIPRVADRYDLWRAVVLRGGDGYLSGDARPTVDGRDASGDEYVVLGLRPRVDRRADVPVAVGTEDARALWTLGTWGYAVARSGTTQSLPVGYRWNHQGTFDGSLKRRARRLDGEPGDARIPGVFKPGAMLRLPLLRPGWGTPASSISTVGLEYWAGQVGIGTNTWDVSAAQVADLIRADELNAVLLDVVGRAIDDGVVTGARDWVVATVAAGVVRAQDAGGGERPVIGWLPEVWHERTLGDTLFGDLFTLCGVSWAPGPQGTIRPVWLGADVDPVAHIGPEDVRDRDHTVSWTYDAPIARVTVTGMRPVVSAIGQSLGQGDEDLPPPAGSVPEFATPATVDVVSDELAENGLSGRQIRRSASAYHRRDTIPLLDEDEAPSRLDLLHRIVEWAWTRAVQRYGRAVPSAVLRVRRSLDVWPGDVVTVTLPNMPGRDGSVGVTGCRAVVVERGDRIIDGTAEIKLRLIGWHG